MSDNGEPRRDGVALLDADDRHLAAFHPIRLRTAADEVAAVLANAIAGGLYAPGDLLPRERDLAERLRVSRTVVREGVRVLAREGLVTVRRGAAGGVTVASLAQLPHLLANLRGETQETIHSLLEARRPLELAAAQLAAERATDADLADLRALVEPLRDLVDEPERFLALDARFHRTLPRIARSPVLEDLLQGVLARLLAAISAFPFGRVADLPRALANQEATLAALESRDLTRVAAAMDTHLATLEEQFLGHRLLPTTIARGED